MEEASGNRVSFIFHRRTCQFTVSPEPNRVYILSLSSEMIFFTSHGSASSLVISWARIARKNIFTVSDRLLFATSVIRRSV